jgi:hypothetical protein
MEKLMKHPSAWLPIGMSFTALVLLVGYIAFFGMPQSSAKDEGSAARLFQILMAGQLPIIAFFIFKYLRKERKPAAQILLIQSLCAFMVFASVVILEL